MKSILIIITYLLIFNSPLFGQNSQCDKAKLMEMMKMGLSNKEIIEACSKISKPEAEKTTEKPSIPEVHKTIEKPSIPEEDKPKVRLTY